MVTTTMSIPSAHLDLMNHSPDRPSFRQDTSYTGYLGVDLSTDNSIETSLNVTSDLTPDLPSRFHRDDLPRCPVIPPPLT